MVSRQILLELKDVIKKGNHRAERLLNTYKDYLNLSEYKDNKIEIESGIIILKEIIYLRHKLDKTKNIKRKLIIGGLIFALLTSFLIVSSEINTKINGVNYITTSDDGIRIYNDYGSLLAIFNDEEKNFTARFEGSMMNNDNINDSSRFVERNLNNGSRASAAITVRNDIPYSASFGLTSSRFSFDKIGSNVVGISSIAPGDMVFMNRYNYPFIWYINKENDTSIENLLEVMRLDEDGLYINGTIDSEDGIGVTLINAINVSTDNLNADLIQAPLGKFENITGDKLNIDLIYATDIVVDNIEVTDLITGGNA